MHIIPLIISLSIMLVSCGFNQQLEYYPMDAEDVVFVKPNRGDLNAYTATILDAGEESQTAIISIERLLSIDLFTEIDDANLSDSGFLVEKTTISGFNQMKNDVREKHIATTNSGAILLYAIRARNGALYYLRNTDTGNFGVTIWPNSTDDLASTFTGNYNIEKCMAINNCIIVGTYDLNIMLLDSISKVRTPAGIFDALRLQTIHNIAINDEDYNISYRIDEIRIVHPPIGLVKFSLQYSDIENPETLEMIAVVTKIDLPIQE